MKYTVTISEYKSGQGHIRTSPEESGACSEVFTAEDWYKSHEFYEIPDDEWLEIEVSFYNDEDDPLFDDPISASEFTAK